MECTDFVPGDIFVVNPDTPHCIGSEGSVSYRCLIIDSSFCRENGIPVEMLTFQSLIRDPRLRQLYEAAFAAYEKRESGALCAIADIRYCVLGLLRHLCDYARQGKEDRSEGDKYVKKAISYIREHIRMVCRLIKCGVNLKGYMYWNDADSYEELDGYRLRFGLTWVNHETGERVWKKSRYYFSEICKSRMVN